MLPQRIQSEIQRIDARVGQIDQRIESEDLIFQSMFSQHLVLAAAGLIENAASEILSNYTMRRGNDQIARFVRISVSHNNSINCEKLQKILDQFDTGWWPLLLNKTTEPQRSAVNSLKTLRDQIAHGNHNGTGFGIVKQYYVDAKGFLHSFSSVVT
jgi:hypothetical protein